jgi:hypothetical protein
VCAVITRSLSSAASATLLCRPWLPALDAREVADGHGVPSAAHVLDLWRSTSEERRDSGETVASVHSSGSHGGGDADLARRSGATRALVLVPLVAVASPPSSSAAHCSGGALVRGAAAWCSAGAPRVLLLLRRRRRSGEPEEERPGSAAAHGIDDVLRLWDRRRRTRRVRCQRLAPSLARDPAGAATRGAEETVKNAARRLMGSARARQARHARRRSDVARGICTRICMRVLRRRACRSCGGGARRDPWRARRPPHRQPQPASCACVTRQRRGLPGEQAASTRERTSARYLRASCVACTAALSRRAVKRPQPDSRAAAPPALR